jgi:integrase
MQFECDHLRNADAPMFEEYKALIRKSVLIELINEQQTNKDSGASIVKGEAVSITFDLLKEFDRFAIRCGQSLCSMTEYYRTTRWMLQKWGSFELEDTSIKLNEHNYSARTYNHRRACLNKFYDWMVARGKIAENPLADVKNRRKEKSPESRSPFTDKEASEILEALRLDLFCKLSSRYSHKQYYPFIAFMLHVGTRNGEAIGLRVKDVDFQNREIKIEHSFSRTLNGTNISARVLKSTKNDNLRFIPMDQYLYNILLPLCHGRRGEDFVFVNENQNPIDDKMFQRRVWKRVLQELQIPKRDLYACRHTFATRAVRQGLKPHEVAYLMGDTVQTILKTYFHNNLRPNNLPTPVTI